MGSMAVLPSNPDSDRCLASHEREDAPTSRIVAALAGNQKQDSVLARSAPKVVFFDKEEW
jgi:hypothetical protein